MPFQNKILFILHSENTWRAVLSIVKGLESRDFLCQVDVIFAEGCISKHFVYKTTGGGGIEVFVLSIHSVPRLTRQLIQN